MLFSLLKHYLNLHISDTALSVLWCVSLLLYIMVLKTISPGCGVQASLMLFLYIPNVLELTSLAYGVNTLSRIQMLFQTFCFHLNTLLSFYGNLYLVTNTNPNSQFQL